jgi:plastocyanin
MPNYRGVTRIITIHIHKIGKALKTGQKYAIEVCPEHAEALVGDTVTWKVQNAPSGVTVTVGNFRRLDQPPDILVRANKPPLAQENTVRVAKKLGLTHKVRAADVGYYKYDVLFNGHTVLDPDLEIRGPR